MPHRIEVAPSGRASCRGCKQAIAKGGARFAEEYASPYAEDGGLAFRYWHLGCAAVPLANELGQALASYPEAIDDRASIEALIAQHLRPPMPYAERAATGRARCRGCNENIAKGDLRVAFERTFDGPMGPQKAAAYVHAKCLSRHLERQDARRDAGPAASPERGSALDDLLAQVRAHSKLAADDLALVETLARA